MAAAASQPEHGDTSIVGGTVSIWMVLIGGGAPTKLADGAGVAVAPEGGSMVFIPPPPQGENGASLVVGSRASTIAACGTRGSEIH